MVKSAGDWKIVVARYITSVRGVEINDRARSFVTHCFILAG